MLNYFRKTYKKKIVFLVRKKKKAQYDKMISFSHLDSHKIHIDYQNVKRENTKLEIINIALIQPV